MKYVMDDLSKKYYSDLRSADADIRYEAFNYLMKETQTPVDWAYEIWEELAILTETGSNHERAIATQLLTNLAKSDPERRMLKDFDRIMPVTREEKFVMPRPTLQGIWKIGVLDKEFQDLVVDRLVTWYEGSAAEKNVTMIRTDIMENLRRIFGQFQDETVKEKALALTAKETNLKLQAKSAGLWKGTGSDAPA